MKTYHIRFTENDFTSKTTVTVDQNTKRYIWRTPVYDLYDNPQYKNYSVKKANYGTNLLNNGVYTGLNKISNTASDIGYVSSGRFIDTSGRVDIVDWKVSFDATIELAVASTLSVFTTKSSSSTPYYLHATPTAVSDWGFQQNILAGRSIFNIDSSRYAFFEISFEMDSGISLTGKSVELIISIDIDPPVVDGYFTATRQLQDKFPEWMALREYDPSDPFSATPATPSSVGGQFLNAIAGEWLSDLTSKIRYQEFQFHIDTVDMDQAAWVYITEGVDDLIWSITGDGVQLARTSNLEEFFASNKSDNAFFWNRITKEIFTYNLYTDLSINGTKFYQKPYHVWNSLDDIGVSLDLFRIQSATPTGYLEDNDSFKKRILDVYKNRPGISRKAFQTSLRRELNLWKYWDATPSSDFAGATPNILEIPDLEEDSNFFIDGIPTQEFKDLVHRLAVKYPMTWGFFEYEKAFWDADGILGHNGFSTLPRQYDATPVLEQYLESGVGDGNDLYIFKPKNEDSKTNFKTKIKVRGRKKTQRTEYIPLTFGVKVYAVAAEDLWSNPTLSGNFTIELTVIDNSATPASPLQSVYYCNTTVSATNDTNFFNATPSASARSFVEWTTTDGYTDVAYVFKDKVTGSEYVGNQIPLSMVTQVVIKPGHYNGNSATPSYDNAPTQSTYKVWFDGQPLSVLGLGGSSTSLTKAPFTYATHLGAFWFESQSVVHSGATPNTWKSQEYSYNITLNGLQPTMGVKNYNLLIPTFTFPASTSSRSIIVELTTKNGSSYGSFSDYTASTPIFIPSSFIAVDGNTTWTNGYQKTFSTSTSSITFSTVSGTGYPISGNVWESYEKSILTSIDGTVDGNGPWRYGISPAVGNTNYLLSSLSLSRDSFGIPNTTDYILTWIGIESVSSPNVVSWFETNTIKPAVTDPGEINISQSYPSNAVVESLNLTSNKYEFSTINLYARLKPGVNEKWNPKIHSGWFYDDVDEYYLYASPNTQTATGIYKILPGVNRQGAPIIIDGIKNSSSTPIFSLRQTAFWDSTPTISLTSTQTETVSGNGKNYFLTAFKDIYNIAVFNLTTGASVSVISTSSNTNKITLSSNSNPNHTYKITYQVAKSFYADNNFKDTDNVNKTKIVFDKTPAQNGVDSYRIQYETSIYDPATPADIPLNPLYTSIEEGFIYIDHDVYDLNQVEISVSPTKIIADGFDYAIVTIRSYDIYGNPKPYQSFNLFTNFGKIEDSKVTTDRDGFAYTTLTSTNWIPSTPSFPATPILPAATPGSTTQGLILADGVVDGRLGFEIQIPLDNKNRIVAVLDSDHILADGNSATFILGKVETYSHAPVPYAYVSWKKSRNMYDLFTSVPSSSYSATPGSNLFSGRVVADANGRFSIGPFKSDIEAGYWLASVESSSASPSGNFAIVGDVVYWYEYPNVTNSIDPITQFSSSSIQSSTPGWKLPQYTYGSAFPTTYDENYPQAGYNNSVIVWTPPSWYAIDRYKQYQMGLYGSQYNFGGATPKYPDYKEL
jgi:hypothetical protein